MLGIAAQAKVKKKFAAGFGVGSLFPFFRV